VISQGTKQHDQAGTKKEQISSRLWWLPMLLMRTPLVTTPLLVFVFDGGCLLHVFATVVFPRPQQQQQSL